MTPTGVLTGKRSRRQQIDSTYGSLGVCFGSIGSLTAVIIARRRRKQQDSEECR